MEANIIVEIKSALDYKKNAEIQQILQNGYHISNVI